MKHTPEYILSESIKLKALKIERMMKDNQTLQSNLAKTEEDSILSETFKIKSGIEQSALPSINE